MLSSIISYVGFNRIIGFKLKERKKKGIYTLGIKCKNGGSRGGGVSLIEG